MRDIFKGLVFNCFSYFHSLNTHCVGWALEPLKHQWIKIHLYLDNLIRSVWRWQQMGPWAIYEGHQLNKTRSRHNGQDCIYKQDLSSIDDIGEVYAQSPKYTKRHPLTACCRLVKDTEVSNNVTPDWKQHPFSDCKTPKCILNTPPYKWDFVQHKKTTICISLYNLVLQNGK